MVDQLLASEILYSTKLKNARLTVAADYTSPFFRKRINSASQLWSQPCLYIHELIYLSIHNDHSQYWALGSCY